MATLPLKHLTINSGYGKRIHPITHRYRYHTGVDLKARRDTVYAVLDGRVSQLTYDPALGIYLSLAHGNRFETLYGHLSIPLVRPDDSVKAGEPIAVTGATGHVTGEHLHFSVRCDGKYVNPLKFLHQIISNHGQQQKI
ncbi:M23 family metallopeptidase [Mucilaginibacter sp. PAMB04274]|uniref:M23 family metallopeptidase n=1 Tax=Mucilaginibacter sp. PAMB04274 TaxID=3138568 RepID=UPI0031F62B7B